MAFPVVPALAAAGIGLLLLMSSSSASAKGGDVEPPVPPPPPPGPNKRKRPINPPAGFIGWATITPSCAGEKPSCNNGLLLREMPDTGSPLVGHGPPEGDTSPTSPHALTGEEVAVIADGVPDQSSPPTSRVWAQVMTSLGNVGFVSWIDPKGRKNFTNMLPPDAPPIVVAGYPHLPFAKSLHIGGLPMGNRRYARCVAPAGCHLRTGSPMMPSVVAHGAMLQVLSTAPGGLAYVRHHDPVRGTVDGWISTQHLQG